MEAPMDSVVDETHPQKKQKPLRKENFVKDGDGSIDESL